MTHVQTSCLSPKQFTHFFIFNYYYHKIPLCHSKEHHPYYAQCWPLCYSIVSTTDTHTSVISRHHFKSVLGFRSPLVINYSNFSLAIPDMPFTLLPFGRQKILFG